MKRAINKILTAYIIGLSIFYMIALFPISLHGQAIVDTWSGNLNIANQPLSIVLHINDSTATKVTLDSPDQSANGIPSDSSSFLNNNLFLKIDKFHIVIIGSYDAEKDSIFTTFSQAELTEPVTFGRGFKEEIRAQDPTSFPYNVEEIAVVTHENDTLRGTLTTPADTKASTIVVLISGSGAQNRNEEIFNHRPFLVLSDYLTKRGIAVIRYDDRGTGESTGTFSGNTTFDFALDVEDVVNFITSRDDLKNMSIGLIGHSEGGIIAPIVADKRDDIDFIVLLAGPGIRGDKLLLKQKEDIMIASNMPHDIIETDLKNSKKSFKIATNKRLSDQQKHDKLFALQMRTFSKYPSEWQNNDMTSQAEMACTQLSDPWLKCFLTTDPQKYLRNITVPVLAINGTNDLQVNSRDNLAAIEKALKKAGNTKYSIVEAKMLNHLFQKCLFGSPNLYKSNPETFNEEAMEIVGNWIINNTN
ncbi:MAG: alpha/beta hydrolase [Bacteroidales bacterium]|nr:alpha/beta hydrolase [Bacteroidales bacterium]